MTRMSSTHPLPKISWFIAVSVLSVVGGVAGQESIYQKLVARSDLSLFRDALHISGFNERSLLADTSQTLTLFAPSDEALAQESAISTYLDQPGWSVHLKEMSELHMIVGDALPSAALFSTDGLLDTSQGTLEVSSENQTIEGLAIVGSIFATNGIIHIVDGVFQNEWKGVKLSERTAALTPSSLNEVILETGFEKELDKVMGFGTTFVAAADQLMDDEGDNVAIWKSLLNESSTEETYDKLLYGTINVNLYEQLFQPAINYLATPRGGKAQMWVTKDEEGTIRFNDAVASRFEMAENGVFYSVDKLLSPPGMVEFLGLTAAYSDLEVMNAYDLFISSSWNSPNLAWSLGIEKGKLAMFAPTDDAWNSLPVEETDRMLSPLWSRHLDDLLKHWLVDKSYTRNALRDVAVSAGGAFDLTMVSGSTVTVVADSDDAVSITDGLSAGSFMKPTNLRGVEGLIHVVGTVLLPPSYQYSVFERVSNDPQLTILASVITASQVDYLTKGIRPLTLLAPEDVSLAGYNIYPSEATEMIQSHLFEGLLFADVLLDMDGEIITSVNELEFLVTVVDGTATISAVGSSWFTNATVVASDILGNTGVMHRVDGVLADAALRPSSSSAPTPSSTQIYLTGEVVTDWEPTEGATFTPSEAVSTELPNETNFPTDAQTGTLLPIDKETSTPSDGTETNTPSTDSPTGEATTSIEPTHGADNIATTLHESLLTEGSDTGAPSASSASGSPPTEDGDKTDDAISSSPSLSPTQLVEVVVLTAAGPTEQDNSRQVSLPPESDPSVNGQTASATSNAHKCRLSSILLFGSVALWTTIQASVSLEVF